MHMFHDILSQLHYIQFHQFQPTLVVFFLPLDRIHVCLSSTKWITCAKSESVMENNPFCNFFVLCVCALHPSPFRPKQQNILFCCYQSLAYFHLCGNKWIQNQHTKRHFLFHSQGDYLDEGSAEAREALWLIASCVKLFTFIRLGWLNQAGYFGSSAACQRFDWVKTRWNKVSTVLW